MLLLQSHVCLFVTPWTAVYQASLSFTISLSLLKFMPTESVMPTNHLILCHLLFLLPSIFPSIRVFSMSQLFASGGQSIGASVSASVLPMNIQGWFPSGWTGLISLQSKGLTRVFSNTTVQKHQFFGAQPSYGPDLTSIHDHWKSHTLTRRTVVSKVLSLLFNVLSRWVMTFLPKSKRLLCHGCSHHPQYYWSPRKWIC